MEEKGKRRGRDEEEKRKRGEEGEEEKRKRRERACMCLACVRPHTHL